jgi:chromosome segregation ATPase
LGYLITHIAICLVFAQLLGLLLGWLLWGYLSRQRGQEVQMLRERLADMHLEAQRRAAVPDAQRVLAPPTRALLEGDLPGGPQASVSFFREAPSELSAIPQAGAAAPLAPDLEAEVKAAKIQHLEQQVRELESARDRFPLLQADLSDAIAGRRAAEARVQEANNDFEVRSSSLLMQIRDFENAATAWDKLRNEFEREVLARDKELASVSAHLRDLQNNQRPQIAEPLQPAPSHSELAELRDRYQKALKERDTLAAELNALRNGDSGAESQSLKGRAAELEDALKGKDAKLNEQVTRIESLLWRVAELEPFAAAVPQMDEDLRRHQSEIAGHMAMHTESSERIRALQNRVAELEAETASADELKRALAEHQAEMDRLRQAHAREVAEATQAMQRKDTLLADFAVAREQQAGRVAALQGQVADLQSAVEHAAALEKTLADRNLEFDTLRQEHNSQSGDLRQALAQKEDLLASQRATNEKLHARIHELEASVQHVKVLEESLRDRDADLEKLRQEHARQIGEWQQTVAQKVSLLSERTAAVSNLEAQIAELQAAVQRASFLEESLNNRETELLTLQQAHAAARDSLSERDAEVNEFHQRHAQQSARVASLQQQLAEISSSLSIHQQRLAELEPVAAKAPAMEQQLAEREAESRSQLEALAERHQTELTRLKVNSAQRIRRLRQSITNFKS